LNLLLKNLYEKVEFDPGGGDTVRRPAAEIPNGHVAER